jgi:hypothetical protein
VLGERGIRMDGHLGAQHLLLGGADRGNPTWTDPGRRRLPDDLALVPAAQRAGADAEGVFDLSASEPGTQDPQRSLTEIEGIGVRHTASSPIGACRSSFPIIAVSLLNLANQQAKMA